MDFSIGLGEVIAVRFAQQHGAFDPLGVKQLGGLSFREPKEVLPDPAGLRVAVAPPPELDQFRIALHPSSSTEAASI